VDGGRGPGPAKADRPVPSPVIGWPSAGTAWWSLAVLMAAYLLALVDRQFLTLLVEPIQTSLRISDTKIGLLQGFAFGLFYTLVGLPLGWLADRRDRRLLLSAGVALWSIATACCALANDFETLFLARMFVGIGEAALAPVAVSLIADLFAPERRPLAMGAYVAAGSAGAGLAMFIGALVMGWVAGLGPISIAGRPAFLDWQLAFMVVGLPGLLVAWFVYRLKEPPRITLQAEPAGALAPFLKAKRKNLLPHILAFGLYSLMVYALLAWIPTFLLRSHEMPVATSGIWFGGAFALLGPIVAFAGGWTARTLRRHGRHNANLMVAAAGITASMVPFVLGPIVSTGWLALVLFAAGAIISTFPSGASVAALQELAPNQLRGRVAAIYYFSVNLIGLGLGPTVAGYSADTLFDGAIGQALFAIVLVFGALSSALIWIAVRNWPRQLEERDAQPAPASP
jgi:MFS family permease